MSVFLFVTIPFAGFYCSESVGIRSLDDDSVTIPFAGFYCSELLGYQQGGPRRRSQSRSRDFIVLREVYRAVRNQLIVTIPFAGFYCSEMVGTLDKVYTEVTIPFAGFYCSETKSAKSSAAQ